MPLQNRVTPSGGIVADPGRGLMLGKRGCLHRQGRALGVSRWRSNADFHAAILTLGDPAGRRGRGCRIAVDLGVRRAGCEMAGRASGQDKLLISSVL
jgi:hypothetical protein